MAGKPIGRREFLARSLAAGMSLTAAKALWSREQVTPTPRRGGTFRVGLHDGSTTDSLDPATTSSFYMAQLSCAARSYLTMITSASQLGPDLATAWEPSSDARTWIFELARGVEFHNGKPFTAADAVASLNYHRGPQSRSAAKAFLEDVDSIEADGSHRLVIRMASGNADLPYLLTDYHLVMMPSDSAGQVDWWSGTGTGPYRLERLEPGVRSFLSRYRSYHLPDQAYYDAVELTAVRDVGVRQLALISNQLDAISSVDLRTVDRLRQIEDIRVDETPSGTHCTLPMFCDTPPFDNLHVRLALKYAIDRDEMVRKILCGHGAPGNDHPIGPMMPFHADLPQRGYDPDQAQYHLRKAGRSGLRVSLSSSDFIFPGAVDLAALFRESAAKAGITIDVIREPGDGYWSNVWLKRPFTVAQWGARPTPDMIFSLCYKAYPAAESRLAAALESAPKEAQVWQVEAALRLAQGRQQEAIFAYSQALDRAPGTIQALLGRATLSIRLGRIHEALADLNTVKTLLPGHPIAELLRASIELARGNPTAARDRSEKVLRVMPKYPRALLVAGLSHLKLGELAQADERLGKALAAAPESPAAQRAMISLRLHQRRYDEAIALLEPLARQSPNDPKLLAELAQTCLRAGHQQQGRTYAQRAVALVPESAKLRRRLARAELAAGLPEEAAKLLGPAHDLATEPANDPLRALAQLRSG